MKLQNTKPGETPNQTIIRCANNLVKAVLAAGYSLHSVPGVSGLEISFYAHHPEDICVSNILSHWNTQGKSAVKVTFKPIEPENDLTQDDAGEENAERHAD